MALNVGSRRPPCILRACILGAQQPRTAEVRKAVLPGTPGRHSRPELGWPPNAPQRGPSFARDVGASPASRRDRCFRARGAPGRAVAPASRGCPREAGKQGGEAATATEAAAANPLTQPARRRTHRGCWAALAAFEVSGAAADWQARVTDSKEGGKLVSYSTASLGVRGTLRNRVGGGSSEEKKQAEYLAPGRRRNIVHRGVGPGQRSGPS
ncbi:PREDICTED: uncharacterized protein LOC103588738 [Galeopterus variegatus]|uniref:Uncharacterized protein LOC103588738 n=1 Tax=Galeopterus variegatus TaxID=482537 RepID=A0ABM0QK69_GALVR|nr:PREDICTED: uncharacterized protein LOC103588738 [Galeopterus variegatus]